MKLSEMKQVLAENNIRLTKSLGQNFLHDAHQLERIADAAGLTDEDRVMEIGPGLGPLTEQLLSKAKEVLAIEKDRRLFEFLKKRLAGMAKLTLVHDDALKYLRRSPSNWRDWKLVSNLPYSVASPILVELAQEQHPPRLLVATLQLEVAQRLFAGPGEKDYGLLALLVQLPYRPITSFKIPASCFFPEPEVDSACITMERRDTPLLEQQQVGIYTRIVKRSFSQRRKMMLKLLKEDWPQAWLAEGFQQVGLQVHVRAEAVSLEQFVRLSQFLTLKAAEQDRK